MATNENDNRVRISYGDLQELAKKYDSNEKHNRGSTERDDSPAEGNGRSRRPDKPIYRPGSNRTRGKNYSTGDSHHYANASEDRISRSGKSDINYEVREISQRLDQMTASARSNDSGHGDNNHHGDRNKFKQNKFGSRRPDRSLYVPKGVRQSQVPGTSGDKEQQYDKEMQDQFALPGEEESWEDDVDQHIMSNDHDGNDQVTDGGGHLEADRQLTGDVKPGAGKEQMVSKGKGRGRGKRVPQQTDEVVTKDNNNSDREHSDHSRDSLDWDYHPSENYQFVNSQFGSGTRSGGAGVYNGTESQQSSRGRGRRKGTRRERTEASYRGDSRDDDDGGHLERSESYHGNMKARPPANRNRNQPPYRQRENSQSQEECEAEYKDLSDKIDQLSSDYQKRTGSLQRDSSWGKSQSRRSGSQERKDYRPPPRSGSRESIQTDYNRQRSGSFDYSATRHSKGRHHDHNSYSGYPGDSLSPTRQRKGINNQAYSHHDDEPTYTSPRRASSETKEKVPLLPDPPGHRRRNDSELSWGEQIEQEEEEERMKQEQHKLEESKQPRHYRMPDQHRSVPEHRTRSYSEQLDEHLGGNDRGSSGRWHGGGGGYHDNRYHDNRGYRDNYKDNHYSDRRGGYNSNTRGSRSGSEGPARPQRPNSAESRSGSGYSTDNKGGYRQRYDSGGDGRSTNSPASSNTHTGGILRLPPNAAAAAMGKPVVHNPHYPPPSMSHSTHQQPAATQSSVRGEISGNHQLYDPNNPNASHPNTQGQRGKTNNPPPPSQHYHGSKPLQFQEQPMYGGDSAAPQTNGPTSPGYVVSSPPYGHPPPPGGQYPGYTATAPPPPFYGHPAMYPPMYMDPAYAGQRPPVDQNHMMRFQQLMMELHPALLELSAFVAHYQQGTLTLYPQILESKQKVQQLCVQIVLADLQYCQDNSMDRVMWKWCFHVIIEALRMQDTNHQKCLQQIKNSNEDTTTQEKVIEETHKRLLDILDEATKFYEAFLEQLQSSYHFKLDDLLNPSIFTIESTSHSVKQIKYIVQQVLLCLGDIARYRVQATKSSNYAKPKNWYTKARQVLPKNSRPYNQLAIIAQYTRRKLDAVYFYIRSIEAQNSYHPARENLLSLFEDARKKSKASEELARSEREARELMTTQCKQGGTRQETWVHPDGSKQKEDLYKRSLATGGVDVDHLKQLSPVELNNRFIVSFLNVHGKLFTAVGLDSYDDACLAMLHEFRVLLQHSPSPLSHTRLVQLMAINMYMISNTTSKDPNLAENVRPVAQEHAVQLALDMFAILAIQSMAQVKSHQAAPHGQILSDDLHQLIPSIKVFADWMTCHSEVWNPPPLGRDPESGMNIDVWKAVADLCNVVAALDISHVKLYDQKKDSCDPVILQEDQMLEGFVPLFKLYNPPKWVHSTVDKDVARDCLQVDKLCVFAEWLCGIDEPLLCYNVAERRYVSCAPTFVEKAESTTSSTTKSSDVVVESSPSDSEDSSQRSPVPDLHPDDTTSTAFSDLVTKHAELKDRKNQLDKKQKFLKAVLEDKPRYIELEIHPIFLIADTNCWVDELKELQALLNCGKFTVILPLMVLFELDGLSSESPTHGTKSPDLHNKARHAVSFLEAEFQKSSHPYLKAVTSQGSVLDSITFRSETHNDKCTNDDVILNCCTFYCKDNAREFMPHDKDEAITLYREVVLLTSDVNLRVKAHLRNIPTKSVTAFMHWSKVT